MKRKYIALVIINLICIVLLYQIGIQHILHKDPVYDFKESSTIGEYDMLQCEYEQQIKQDFIAESYWLEGFYYILVGFEPDDVEATEQIEIEIIDQENNILGSTIVSYQDMKPGEWQNIQMTTKLNKGKQYSIVFVNLSRNVSPYILTGKENEVSKCNAKLWKNEQKMDNSLYIGYGFEPEVDMLEIVVLFIFILGILLYSYKLAFEKNIDSLQILKEGNCFLTKRITNKFAHVIIGGILGGIVFLVIYGTKVLNPTYTAWLMAGGDLSQHYLGWKFFRKDPWFFPIGLMQSIIYPEKASVIFSDSIPLFAVIFKLIDNIFGLPKDFQYFGIWGIMCMILQGSLAAKILEKYLERSIDILSGTLFLILSPIIIQRMYNHTSLAGHWIILLCIYMVCYQKEIKRAKGLVMCGLIGFLAASIHIYFLPMCGALLLVYAILDAKDKKSVIKGLEKIIVYLVVALLTVWILGGFVGGISPEGNGLEKFGMNLNSFFNPYDDYSSIFSTLPRFERSEEGFAYLGFGMIILLCVTSVSNAIKGYEMSFKKVLLYIIGIILIIAAISPRIVCNKTVLITMHVPTIIYDLWSIFRATARLIWPVYYLIILYAILGDRKQVTGNWKSVLLIFCLIVQCIDFRVIISQKHEDLVTPKVYSSFMENQEWQEVLAKGDYKHIIFASNIVTTDLHALYGVADYAVDHDITISNFYLARDFRKEIYYNLSKALENPQDDDLFIVYKSDDEELRNCNMNTKQIGDFILGSTNKNFY